MFIGIYNMEDNIKKFEMTEEDKEEIIRLLNSRSYIGIRNLLKQLKEINTNYEKFFEEIKKLVRESGRTSMVSIQEIEKLIVEVRE